MPATNETGSILRSLTRMASASEESSDLVHRAQRGDVAAIRELFLYHHEHIYRFLWSRVHDSDLADDLTGDVFMRMIKALPNYQDRSLPFRAWLYGIARNLAIDYQRKKGPKITMPLSEIEINLVDGMTVEDQADQTLRFKQVGQILEQLNPDEREVVELRFLAGLSLKETALAINKTVAAVKALQHRGLHTLKAKLAD